MPLSARQKSIIGIYHIVLSGVDKRNIFLENEDGWLEYKVVINFNDNTVKDIICKDYCISNV